MALCECDNWARADNSVVWPMSDHHPRCEHYRTEKFKRIGVRGHAGHQIVEMDFVPDPLDDGEEYEIDIIELTRDQFERLPEFMGY